MAIWVSWYFDLLVELLSQFAIFGLLHFNLILIILQLYSQNHFFNFFLTSTLIFSTHTHTHTQVFQGLVCYICRDGPCGPCVSTLWVMCSYVCLCVFSAARSKAPTEVLCPVCWWVEAAHCRLCPGLCWRWRHQTSDHSSAPSPGLSLWCLAAPQAVHTHKHKHVFSEANIFNTGVNTSDI